MTIKFEKIVFSFLLFFSMTLFFTNSHSSELPQRYTPQRYNIYSSDEKKFVWIRVFKNASSTTKGILSKKVPDLTRTRPKEIPNKFKNYFKFAFVRNPWDRVVSCYYNKVLTKKTPDFKECFDKGFDYFVDFINNLDVSCCNSHLKLQTRLIPVDECDFIGKMDHFADDFKDVSDIIGIEFDHMPHRHRTDHSHYSTYYNSRTKKIIAMKYKEDIETFGFKFETE